MVPIGKSLLPDKPPEAIEIEVNSDEGWCTIQSKTRPEKRPLDSPGSENASPSPSVTFKSLKRVDEVDLLKQDDSHKKLSKSALKKLRRKSGKASPVKK